MEVNLEMELAYARKKNQALAAQNRELQELIDGAMSAAESAGARARAEGRLKGIKDMHTEIHLALADDTEKDRGHVHKWGLSRALRILETAIAAAERELAGGKEDGGGR